jgi:hypothetical protein
MVAGLLAVRPVDSGVICQPKLTNTFLWRSDCGQEETSCEKGSEGYQEEGSPQKEGSKGYQEEGSPQKGEAQDQEGLAQPLIWRVSSRGGASSPMKLRPQ